MDRWTMEELERTDDLTFAICILAERRSKLNWYSPLSMKIQEAQQTLRRIKEAQDRFMQDICPLNDKEIGEAMDKAADIVNAIDEAEDGGPEPCDPCQPTQPECGECEFAEEATDLSSASEDIKRKIMENDIALKAREAEEWG